MSIKLIDALNNLIDASIYQPMISQWIINLGISLDNKLTRQFIYLTRRLIYSTRQILSSQLIDALIKLINASIKLIDAWIKLIDALNNLIDASIYQPMISQEIINLGISLDNKLTRQFIYLTCRLIYSTCQMN